MRNPLKCRPSTDPKPSLRERLRATKAKAGRVLAVNRILLKPDPKPVPAVDRVALVNYATWLHMERRLVCHELYPQMGAGADRFVLSVTGAEQFHFPSHGDWRDVPKPSTRAVKILDAIGVDWRRDLTDRGDFDGPSMQASEGTAPPRGWPAVDGGLLKAVSDLQALDTACKAMSEGNVDEDAIDDVPGYRAVEDARLSVIETLTATRAEGFAGLQAKAKALLQRDLVDDPPRHAELSQSLARDLLGAHQGSIATRADPIFAVINEAKRLFTVWDEAGKLPLPAGSIDPRPEYEAAQDAFHRHCDDVLLKTIPRTGKGCAALARYCGEIYAAEGFVLDEDNSNNQHLRVLDLIARSPLL